MKEHLEYSTAEDIDDLIAELHHTNQVLDRLRENVLGRRSDDGYIEVQKKSLRLWNKKRDNLLRALNDALGYMRVR